MILGFKDYQAHFQHLTLLWLLFVIPFGGAVGFLEQILTTDLGPAAAFMVSVILSGLVSVFGAGLLIHSFEWHERDHTYPGLQQSLQFAIQGVGGVYLLSTAATLVAGIGAAFLVIPGLIALASFGLVVVIAFTEITEKNSLAESMDRTRGHRWPLLWFILGFNLITILAWLLLSELGAALTHGSTEAAPWITWAIGLVVSHLGFWFYAALWRANRAWRA